MHKPGSDPFHQPRRVRFIKQIFVRLRKESCNRKFLRHEEYLRIEVERRTGAQDRLLPMCSLRFPEKRPMSAPRATVATIAAPCAPSACHGVENGHAMRQPALIARPAPAPYSAPAIVGRVASEFRNSLLKNRTRIPPANVLPIPQPKPMIHGESCRSSLTLGGTRTRGALTGLVEKVSRVTNTTTKNPATVAA
jgi:hypothetical protein